MKKLFATLFLSLGFLFTCSASEASDIAGLTPCKDSQAFARRLQNSSAKLKTRMSKYEEGMVPADAVPEHLGGPLTIMATMKSQRVAC